MRLLSLALLLLLTLPAHAQEKMLYVEYHVVVADAAGASQTDSQTRKLWRVGTKYLRFEDAPNPETKVEGLIIVAEPDIWVIDRKARQGQHSVDPGPDYAVHFPILAREPSAALKQLEFGNELLFFRNNEARSIAPQTLDGVPCEVWALRLDGRDLTLYMRENGRPFQVSVRSGAAEYAVRITRYDTDKEVDLSLFRPPAGIRIE